QRAGAHERGDRVVAGTLSLEEVERLRSDLDRARSARPQRLRQLDGRREADQGRYGAGGSVSMGTFTARSSAA
ncbi:MAG TPA: hypothetical protein VIH11_01050, partial [Gemmatimonadaceae bacterium]